MFDNLRVHSLRTVVTVWSVLSLFIYLSVEGWSVRPLSTGKPNHLFLQHPRERVTSTQFGDIFYRDDCTTNSYNRRMILSAFLFLPSVCTKNEAMALQPRNEPLCSTGLFENFMEYKCTPIGDIQDEGMSKDLTPAEVAATDSLLTKLGVSSDVVAEE
jgi:hypothetical protein